MSKKVIHSLILIVAIALTFIFPKTGLAQYDIQIAAGLFLVLFIAKKFVGARHDASVHSLLLESVIFTLVVLGIVNTTGGTDSPFFFLIYFLLFSLSLLLEPVISITATLTLVIFFLLNLPNGNTDLHSLLPIFSLAFLTPFALFMGTLYLENQKNKENTFLFLSLMLKNHLKNIKTTVENFLGDHDLESIRKSTHRMEKLIEEYEKENS